MSLIGKTYHVKFDEKHMCKVIGLKSKKRIIIYDYSDKRTYEYPIRHIMDTNQWELVVEKADMYDTLEEILKK